MDPNPLSQKKSTLLITCAKGIVPVLAKEINDLGYPVVDTHPAAVETRGDLRDAMRLNLHLRSGLRVLYRLAVFSPDSPDELYHATRDIAWEQWIREDGYLSVHSAVDHPSINDSRFANVKVKDAIVDRIQAECGRRPDSGPETHGAVVALYWRGRHAALYMDTSATPLTRRGYRVQGGPAPMQEALAAALLLSTRWVPGRSLANPMCGSGTLAIEAALMASGRPAGSLRDHFGFMPLKPFDPAAWEALKQEARRAARVPRKGQIVASDHDPAVLRMAQANAERAGVAQAITFECKDFRLSSLPPPPGIVILNPEYGERMGYVDELTETYQGIGQLFKRRCAGLTAYVFSGNPRLVRQIGLRSESQWEFYNGSIPCRLVEYECYLGTREEEKTT